MPDIMEHPTNLSWSIPINLSSVRARHFRSVESDEQNEKILMILSKFSFQLPEHRQPLYHTTLFHTTPYSLTTDIVFIVLSHLEQVFELR